MINLLELRVGNIILDQVHQPCFINNEAELEAVKMIPMLFHGLDINEYRLREMGFSKLSEPDQLDQYSYGLTGTPSFEVVVNPVWRKERFAVLVEGKDLKHIKYVHQLQNLVFDLTGKVLTVGLDPMP